MLENCTHFVTRKSVSGGRSREATWQLEKRIFKKPVREMSVRGNRGRGLGSTARESVEPEDLRRKLRCELS